MRRTILDDTEDFAHPPTGGAATHWLGGVALALFFAWLGARGLRTGHATLYGNNGSMELNGDPAKAFSCAWIALGVFFHAHLFWGLHDKLWPWSQALKTCALLAFLPCFLFALYQTCFG